MYNPVLHRLYNVAGTISASFLIISSGIRNMTIILQNIITFNVV